MQSDCKIVENVFLNKFGVLPLITFENIQTYGENFLIHKSKSMCLESDKSYYRMGNKLDQALEYINRLIIIPSAILTFKTNKDYRVYQLDALQQQMNLVKT